MIVVYGAQRHHGPYRPRDSRFSDDMGFHSKWFVEDGVVLEPEIAHRVQEATECLDATMRHVWGADGINDAKKEEEGEPLPRQILWGLTMDFDEKITTLPDPKRIT